jgi:hypothetical protein
MTLLSMINGPFATGLKATEEAWAHLGTGQVVYQRQFIVPPGTDPKCPDKDPVFRGKVNLARKRVLSEKVDEVPIEPYPYPTSQGPETAIETTAFITIKNATGGIAPNCDTTQGIVRRDVLARQLNVSLGALPDAVDCYRIPIRTSFGGVTGAYRYFYTAPYDGPFTVVISAAGSASYMKAVEVGRKQ